MKHLLIALFLAMSLLSSGQSTIGLALSGGGAKGMAHIGVLRALEENNIKVDYIAGTSMGAVVGALYSIGYSVDDIEKYLKQINWEAVLTNEIPRDRLGFLDRSTEEKYLLSFKITENSIDLPNAFNYGFNMLKELDYLTQSVHNQRDFSQFKIPFSAVATDLETGEAMVFEEGNLAEVLRASAAFPSVFSPYEINGHLYVDGGVTNNLPIDVLKEKGVTHIIAVDVQATLYAKDKLTSIDKVLEQVVSFQNNTYTKEQLENADVIIRPAVKSFTIQDYAFSDSIIHLGYDETQKYIAEIKNWKVKPKITLPNGKATPNDHVYVQNIQVIGHEFTSSSFIKGKIDFSGPREYSTQQIEYSLDKLFATQFYESVSYSLIPLDTTYTLQIEVKERPEKALFRFGINYNDDFKAALLTNLTLRNILFENSKFSLDLAISENPRFQLQLMSEKGLIPALGLKISGKQFIGKVYQSRKVLSSYVQRDFSLDVFIQSTLYDYFTLGGGVKFENIALNQNIGQFVLDGFNNNYLHYYAFLNFDNLNKTFKPTKGLSFLANGNIISKQANVKGFFEPSSIVSLRLNQAFQPFTKWGLSYSITGATTIGPNQDLPYQIFLGGAGQTYPNFSFPFLGYRFGELIGNNALTLGGELFYEPWNNHFFTAKANFGKMETSFESLFNSNILLDGYGVAYGYLSPLGPMEVTIMTSSNHSDIYTYFSLGYWF